MYHGSRLHLVPLEGLLKHLGYILRALGGFLEHLGGISSALGAILAIFPERPGAVGSRLANPQGGSEGLDGSPPQRYAADSDKVAKTSSEKSYNRGLDLASWLD